MQVAPWATHWPVEVSQHPFTQTAPGQQGWLGPPHATHLGMGAFRSQAEPEHATPSQQGRPSDPQASHIPLSVLHHVPGALQKLTATQVPSQQQYWPNPPQSSGSPGIPWSHDCGRQPLPPAQQTATRPPLEHAAPCATHWPEDEQHIGPSHLEPGQQGPPGAPHAVHSPPAPHTLIPSRHAPPGQQGEPNTPHFRQEPAAQTVPSWQPSAQHRWKSAVPQSWHE